MFGGNNNAFATPNTNRGGFGGGFGSNTPAQTPFGNSTSGFGVKSGFGNATNNGGGGFGATNTGGGGGFGGGGKKGA